MTPKNKADEIIKYLFDEVATTNHPEGSERKIKRIAVFMISEIKKALVGCHTAEEWGNYWEEVEKEVQNLEVICRQ